MLEEQNRRVKEVFIVPRRSYILPLLLVVVMLLGGWALQNKLVEKDVRIAALENQLASWDKVSQSQGPVFPALKTMHLIKSNDLTALSSLVHPT